MKSLIALVVLGLAGCWTGKAPVTNPTPAAVAAEEGTPPAPAPARVEHTIDYRTETIVADAVGVSVMTAGLIALHRNNDSNVAGAAIVTGLAVAGFADPIIHLAHRRGYRALASYLMRAVTTTSGFMVGLAVSDCRELFCGLQGMLWGSAAGLAVAGVADALVLHHDARAWTPTVTASEGGARVGIAAPF